MKKAINVCLGITALFSAAEVLAQHSGQCDPDAQPSAILTTADFDGDGFVTGRDISKLAKTLRSGEYIALFDRNANGALTPADVVQAAHEMGSSSTEFDRELVSVYNATENIDPFQQP